MPVGHSLSTVSPTGETQLVNLQKLWLHHNQIKELPITIEQFHNCKIMK